MEHSTTDEISFVLLLTLHVEPLPFLLRMLQQCQTTKGSREHEPKIQSIKVKLNARAISRRL